MLCKIAEHMLVTTRGHQTCDAFQCRAHAGDHEGPPDMWCVPLQSTCWWPRGVTRHAMLAWVPQSNFIVPFKICWSHCDIDSTKVCTLCDFCIWSIRSDNCYADTCQKPRHGFFASRISGHSIFPAGRLYNAFDVLFLFDFTAAAGRFSPGFAASDSVLLAILLAGRFIPLLFGETLAFCFL